MTDIFYISRVLGLSALAFLVAVSWTPFLGRFLSKHRMGKHIRTNGVPIYASLHKKKEGTPTMGGILIWLTTLFLTILFYYLSRISSSSFWHHLNFLSRGETLLPLGALVASALVGLGDDLLGIFKIKPKFQTKFLNLIRSENGGLKVRHRLLVYTGIALIGSWWFFYKLDWDFVHIPFIGDFNIGFWYIPIFVFIIVATSFSINETDGLDGLAGGILMIAFSAYGIIAYTQGRFDLATFCGVIIGSLLAFLWFNIYPARFFMGDTGAMSLGVTLGIIAMLTNAFLFLPFIAFIPVLESLSTIVQILSKKIRKKKIFYSCPLHHHFEALGWPETKVTMRFWMIAGVMAVIGLILYFIDSFLL